MADELNLRERVKNLENENILLKVRIARLESEHMFGLEQMNRIETTETAILEEIKKIIPLQEVLDKSAQIINAAMDRAEAVKNI